MSDQSKSNAETRRHLRIVAREQRQQQARIAQDARRMVHEATHPHSGQRSDQPAGQFRSGRERRRVNVFGVIVALVFLAIASAGFSGDPWWLFGMAAKWVIAGAIALVGLAFLFSALPRRKTGN